MGRFFCGLLSICLVVLGMEGDEHNGGALEQAGDGAGALGYPERVELLSGHRFDHAVELLEIERGMGPELVTGHRFHRHENNPAVLQDFKVKGISRLDAGIGGDG